MPRSCLWAFALSWLLGCHSNGGHLQPPATHPIGDTPKLPPKPEQPLPPPFVLSQAEVEAILRQHGVRELASRLRSFLTDAGFSYGPADGDLQMERTFPNLSLQPDQEGPLAEKDRAFLAQLQQRYRNEIIELQYRTRDLGGGVPLSKTAATELTGPRFARLLAASAESPAQMELLRKVVHHALIR